MGFIPAWCQVCGIIRIRCSKVQGSNRNHNNKRSNLNIELERNRPGGVMKIIVADWINFSFCVIGFIIGCSVRPIPFIVRYPLLVVAFLGMLYIFENIIDK